MERVKGEPADIKIYLSDGTLVLKEKSIVAYHTESGKIIAIGMEAEQIALKDMGEDVVVMSPLRRGMIVDYTVAEKMFEKFMTRALGKRPLRRPVVAICVPKGITEVEKKAVEDAIIQGGARELVIADIPVEQFVREFREKCPKLNSKIKLIIGIGKEEPEYYVAEELAGVLEYAWEIGISQDRVRELFERAAGSL